MKQGSSPSDATSAANVKEASTLTFPPSVKPSGAAKEELKEEPSTEDELLLEWAVYNSNSDSETIVSISADDLIAQGKSLSETSGAQNEPGEVGERYFELKLVNAEKKKLGNLSFIWWGDSSWANLMNFNIHSGDLADFCRKLWPAAGRRQNQYCDMAIEFGDSPHSYVEVNDLIAETFDSMDEDSAGNYVFGSWRSSNPRLPNNGTRASSRQWLDIVDWKTVYIDYL